MFCDLPFATHVASSTLAAYRSLLAPSPPDLELEGQFPSQIPDHLSSNVNSMKHFRKMFCCRVLRQRQHARSSSALFLRPRNNCEFLVRGSILFTAFWTEFDCLRLVHWINVLCSPSDCHLLQEREPSNPSWPVFLCISYFLCPMWIIFILCLGLSDFVSTFSYYISVNYLI